MINELKSFMYEQSKKEFEDLSNFVGKKINIKFVKNGVSHEGNGTLISVLPFKGIRYSGGAYPFVSREVVIRQISNLDTGEILYDRMDFVSSQVKINKNLGKYRVKILGTNSGAKNEFIDNMTQYS